MGNICNHCMSSQNRNCIDRINNISINFILGVVFHWITPVFTPHLLPQYTLSNTTIHNILLFKTRQNIIS